MTAGYIPQTKRPVAIWFGSPPQVNEPTPIMTYHLVSPGLFPPGLFLSPLQRFDE